MKLASIRPPARLDARAARSRSRSSRAAASRPPTRSRSGTRAAGSTVSSGTAAEQRRAERRLRDRRRGHDHGHRGARLGLRGALFHPAVDALADRYRFVLVDLPGHGRSGRTRVDWTVERYADDLAAVVAALHVGDPILVGHSMSGRVVVEAATGVLRERTRGVVLVDALLDAAHPPGEDARQAMIPDLQRDFAGAVHRIVRSMSPPDAAPAALDGVEASIASMDPAIAVAILDNNLRYPILEKLGRLRQPLWSVNAGWTPTEETGNQRVVPGWKTVVVPQQPLAHGRSQRRVRGGAAHGAGRALRSEGDHGAVAPGRPSMTRPRRDPDGHVLRARILDTLARDLNHGVDGVDDLLHHYASHAFYRDPSRPRRPHRPRRAPAPLRSSWRATPAGLWSVVELFPTPGASR